MALALVVWSLLQPAPLPVIGAMTVGQVLGTVSLLFFLYAIGSDLRTALLGLQQQAMKTPAAMPPPDGGSAHTPE